MLITRVRANNWRSFQEVDISLKEFIYFIGTNGTGKSNLLDIFCFLGIFVGKVSENYNLP